MSADNIANGLYVVATPIGTARDITLRALDILAGVDIIAAEDTRNTRKLLDIHGIKLGTRNLIAYHDHNGSAQRPKILAALKEGLSVALVSDAGTPLVADPGFHLTQVVAAEGFDVFSVPGPSSVMAALSVAGLPSDRFVFEGFLPTKAGARARVLEEIGHINATLVLFESPKRIHDTLIALNTALGGLRAVAVCRELTKKFESVYRGSLADVSATAETEIPAKGEFVIVLGPPEKKDISDEEILAALTEVSGTMRLKDAAAAISDRYKIPRKRVYDLGLKQKGK